MLGDLLGELLFGGLIEGGQRPERNPLLFCLATSIFGLILSFLLLLQNGSSLAVWPEGSFDGLMFAALVAIPGLPVGVMYFVRYRVDRRLSAACALTSCSALLICFWLLSR